ncbi:hypothetical protein ACIO3O_41995 [Streptomyces sp. NPDC087440]|uniref:hypothetical protein n=1 Tax=Streptomyces sp. NPDC087440 TaxID=3365790 RepID=UPI0037FB7C55
MKNIARITVTAALTVSAGMLAVAPSHAVPTTYKGKECSVSNESCFALMFNSKGKNLWESSCFLSNKSISNLAGYFPTPTQRIEYVFRNTQNPMNVNAGNAYCRGDGDGIAAKNNAAAGANGEGGATNTVYFGSGYSGAAQSFSPRSVANLNSQLKNENAAVKRTS